MGYAMGWYVQDSTVGPVFEHNGFVNGYGAFIRVVPQKGFAWLVLANQGPGVPMPRLTARVTRWAMPDWVPIKASAVPLPSLSQLAKVWRNSPQFAFELIERHGSLWFCEKPTDALSCMNHTPVHMGADGVMHVKHPAFIDPLDIYVDRTNGSLALYWLSRRFQ